MAADVFPKPFQGGCWSKEGGETGAEETGKRSRGTSAGAGAVKREGFHRISVHLTPPRERSQRRPQLSPAAARAECHLNKYENCK